MSEPESPPPMVDQLKWCVGRIAELEAVVWAARNMRHGLSADDDETVRHFDYALEALEQEQTP